MNSKKIKQKDFVNQDGKCTAQIVALAEKGKFRLYVAWENEPAAKNAFFGFFKSRHLHSEVTKEAINETMDYGFDISHTPEGKKIFKALF